ncbi:hypothetical protein I7I50_08465 [Histoplasma capsulatum G186AR]|uniref:Uncharacterized protein n=1 Tax=Ajellomyces capsulatus TaxID=5037 RepID=A0A8H8D0Q2_AJECA|nr:hypothetical protein I7I52_05980 [Histoplasma capsulatum]QSS73619.1 hypothetical protein I7I50_08465 [Histoplasma capsulatum G186AR]
MSDYLFCMVWSEDAIFMLGRAMCIFVPPGLWLSSHRHRQPCLIFVCLEVKVALTAYKVC